MRKCQKNGRQKEISKKRLWNGLKEILGWDSSQLQTVIEFAIAVIEKEKRDYRTFAATRLMAGRSTSSSKRRMEKYRKNSNDLLSVLKFFMSAQGLLEVLRTLRKSSPREIPKKQKISKRGKS